MSYPAKIAGVVLAAGSSKRLGRAKQTLLLGGEMLVERAVRVAQEARLLPVLVVVRPDCDFRDIARQRGAIVVQNDGAQEGMAASIRAGVEAACGLEAHGLVVMTCDQPGLRAAHLQALCADPERVTASEYAGRRGVPAYFPADSFGDLLKLAGDAGARELLKSAATVVDESLALDVDTEEDVAKAERWLATP